MVEALNSTISQSFNGREVTLCRDRPVNALLPGQPIDRDRWPDLLIWGLVRREVEGNLFEMMCHLDPDAVRAVLRRDYISVLERPVIGLCAA